MLTPGEGPTLEFYVGGEPVLAYEPQAKFVAVADVTGTVDQMLLGAFETATIYLPFTDVIVVDPLTGFTDGLVMEFVIEKSIVVGGFPTDIVALVTGTVHAQILIRSDDKLPRVIPATREDDPGHHRHMVESRDWKLNPVIPPEAFSSTEAADAIHLPVARPNAPHVPLSKQ